MTNQEKLINASIERAYTPREKAINKEQPKPTEEVVIIMWSSGQMEVYRRDSEELLELFISQHEYIDTVYEAQMKE
jgi:hypothetical protein